MTFICTTLPENMINPLINSIAIVIGALIGGMCSWFVTQRATLKNIEMQKMIADERRKWEINNRCMNLCEYANVIRLDICTACFQSIRTLKNYHREDKTNRYPIPIDSEFSKAIVSLTDKFDLKEMSYIYQLYGIIEKMNNDINKYNYFDKKGYDIIKLNHVIFLKKLYGENFSDILEIDIDSVTFEDLYNNDSMKSGYKKVFQKLENLCTNSKELKI